MTLCHHESNNLSLFLANAENGEVNEEGETVESDKSGDQEDGELMETKKPKPFKSLFIKSLPSNISKNDLIQMCKRYAGFVQHVYLKVSKVTNFSFMQLITFLHVVFVTRRL